MALGSKWEQVFPFILSQNKRFPLLKYPLNIYIANETSREEFRKFSLNNFSKDELKQINCLNSEDEMLSLLKKENFDIVLAAIVGMAGLRSTFYAIKNGLDIALANKESMVAAGNLLLDMASETGSKIIPVDSEHAAIFQCLLAGKKQDINRIFLTASGGPFWQLSLEEIYDKKPEEALKHPNWNMGAKISIDSATMMNKALEWIEAVHLFGINSDKVKIFLHPESQIHSMLEFCDGSILAELGNPDMKRPIRQALLHPIRGKITKQEDFWQLIARDLHIEPINFERFSALKLAKKAMEDMDYLPIVLNTANEVLVAAYLKNKLKFGEIILFLKEILDYYINKSTAYPLSKFYFQVNEAEKNKEREEKYPWSPISKLEAIFGLDEEVRRYTEKFIEAKTYNKL